MWALATFKKRVDMFANVIKEFEAPRDALQPRSSGHSVQIASHEERCAVKFVAPRNQMGNPVGRLIPMPKHFDKHFP